MMHNLMAFSRTMRPQQWIKNGVIFAALVFDEKLLQWQYLWPTIVGFALFCLVSGVVYTINDVVDLEKDRQHPTKRYRPLAAGELSPKLALGLAVGVAMTSLVLGVLLNPVFAVILAGYLLLQLAYSLYLKHIVLLDVMAIAAGFVLRVAGGIPLVNAERFSPWLFICITLLSLFLGLGKRRGELILLGSEATNHRASLEDYNLPLLDHLLSTVTASMILAYALYTFSAPNLPAGYWMMLTIPFVIYGTFRYLYLIHVRGTTLAPDEVVLTDRPLQVDLVLWGLSSVLILYLG
ncbi:MAG TPA: decaprenyl-phosphate phosphoribosyltransferase [Anaerolineae bacterium]|nr:decaprenyl-phosphate phosphoribosyltransferase [Anaerolineae bacterium]HQH37547.1 decaprenyl-phosphate phosphoribosyltransferase [Anaerolineae bacterium]